MNLVRMYTSLVCPYCVRAKALLEKRGVTAIDEVRIDLEPAQRERMIALTGRRTVPQIFIGDTYVGGCDELIALDQRGGLAPLLAAPKRRPPDAGGVAPRGERRPPSLRQGQGDRKYRALDRLGGCPALA